MKLADYLARPGISATTVAHATGVAVSTITRAAAGKVFPSRALLRRIFDATDGMVTPNDFVDIEPASEAA